ncbi:MAG: polyprenyl synthetase family protein [Clostridiales bacterium]|jgi:geranylgeranyl diphosphate synthase type II|nr:polyprenyl synthetase family protein [Clostridiales bacterium]
MSEQKNNNYYKQIFAKQHQGYNIRIDKVLQNMVQDLQYPHRLLDAVKYSLMAGGKRIRPVVFYATLAMFGKPIDDKADLFAASIECIHTYSLIHDDLPCMDDDDIRRGMPSNHMVFGYGTAMLAGNALLNLAYENLLSLSTVRPYQSASVCLAQFSGGMGMIGGQTEDIFLDDSPNISKLEYIYTKKTSALFSACLLSAGLIARADSKYLKYLCEFGNSFGFGFQIKDDLDDYINGKVTDKQTSKFDWIAAYGEESTLKELDRHKEVCREALIELGTDYNTTFLRGLLETYLANNEAKV